MAVSSSSIAALSSFNNRRSISLEPSKLSSSSSSFLRSPPLYVSVTKRHRATYIAQQRRIFPKVEAKTQTYSSFDDLLAKSGKPVLVDFYATWCGPCKYMVPILEEVSVKMGDKVQIIKIDTEKYTKIASSYAIEALPTFIMFRDGKPCDRFEGALPLNKFIQRIEKALKRSK